MAVGTLIRYLAVALFGCLLANTANASDYLWTSGTGATGGSPGEACAGAGQLTYASSSTQAFSRAEVTGVWGDIAGCKFYFTWTPSSGAEDTTTAYAGSTDTVSRSGSTCPVNTGPYDSATGTCPSSTPTLQPGEECADQTGGTASNPMIWDGSTSSCRRFTDAEGDAPCAYIKGIGGGPTAYTVTGTISTGGQAVAPPSFTDSTLSCSVSTVSTSTCTVSVAGAVSCNVTGLLTGTANASGHVEASDAICPNGICTLQEPKTQTKDEPCVPVGNGSGGTSCNQTKETTAEGAQQCGSVNGAYTCITKKPASNGVTTAITATSETLGDGSVKVTTVKDSTATICTDVNTCTTTHSTTTQHSTTATSGGTKTDTSCTGTCNNTGGGVETNPGAGTGVGTGTGNGTCTGTDCGDGGDGTASTTDDCAAPPACDGDPFQCAILQQAHLDTCKLMAMPDATLSAQWEAKIAASNTALDTHQAAMDTQVNTLLGQFQSATAGGGAGGGQCLPDIPISVMGHTVTMEFAKACDTISFVRLIMLAIAYLVAARIVFKEV